ncbi:MAG: SlyX family protein [Candidatus Riflebacteria bacterium]
MEQNLLELEKRVTYLEKYVDELNEVVIEQSRMLARLKNEFQIIRDKQVNSPVDPSRPANEKPPHY